jgi:hypothetical protein
MSREACCERSSEDVSVSRVEGIRGEGIRSPFSKLLRHQILPHRCSYARCFVLVFAGTARSPWSPFLLWDRGVGQGGKAWAWSRAAGMFVIPAIIQVSFDAIIVCLYFRTPGLFDKEESEPLLTLLDISTSSFDVVRAGIAAFMQHAYLSLDGIRRAHWC